MDNTTRGLPPDAVVPVITPDAVAQPPADTTGTEQAGAGVTVAGPGALLRLRGDRGATTAEYAITTLAACGFAALLVIILKSDPIKEAVTGIITTALKLGS